MSKNRRNTGRKGRIITDMNGQQPKVAMVHNHIPAFQQLRTADESAYPMAFPNGAYMAGLSAWDYFFAKAVKAQLGEKISSCCLIDETINTIIETAIKIADRMLEAKQKRDQEIMERFKEQLEAEQGENG